MEGKFRDSNVSFAAKDFLPLLFRLLLVKKREELIIP